MILLIDTGGYFLWFSILQNGIRREMKKEIVEGLAGEDLEVVIIPAGRQSEFQWIKPGKEFRYKGEMYDVVRSRVDGQNTYYHCIRDSREKKLINDFNKGHGTRKESARKVPVTFYSQYFSQPVTWISNTHGSDFLYPALILNFNSEVPAINSPPPRSI